MACYLSEFVSGAPNRPVSPGQAVLGHITRVLANRIDVSIKEKHFPRLSENCRSVPFKNPALWSLMKGLTETLLRLDYAYDPTVVQRMGEATDALLLDRDVQRDEQRRMDRWANYQPRDKRISLIQRGTDLKDFIAPVPGQRIRSASNLFTDNLLIKSWAVRHSTTPPLMTMPGDPPLDHLNPIQIKAIALALQHRLTLIQGVSAGRKIQTGR